MSNELQCPVCDASISHEHRSHRGLLINTIAHLQSALITGRELLALLQKKHKNVRGADLAQNLKLQLETQARIMADEALLVEMKKVQEECYG